MLISQKSSALLQERLQNGSEVFCSGLFLSARWAVLSQIATDNLHLIVLPTRESAEYCSADLYNLTEGDCVFFLPESGKSVERSNYKSSLGVQRTAAIGKILQKADERIFIVTYPEALEEKYLPRKNWKAPFSPSASVKTYPTKVSVPVFRKKASRRQTLYRPPDNMQ